MILNNFVRICTTLPLLSVITAGPVMINGPEASENDVASQYPFTFVSREAWGARRATARTELATPVPYVVVHHSYQPPACHDLASCSKAMRSMQDFHMDDRGWWDIGYHFAVGSDGAVYEGRGWENVGAHSLHFNTVSVGICLIGDWRDTAPPQEQIKAAQALIQAGIVLGAVSPDYKLVGHRQVRDTECPGNALYENIQTWQHYTPHPGSPDEMLKYVPELPDSVKSLLAKKATKHN